MEKITQKNRQLAISTPMGDDYFLLERMKVREGISELFEIDVVMFHEEKVSDLKFNLLKPEDVLGKTVTILINQQDEGSCYYSGMISHFSHRGRSVLHSVYHAKIVPQLWKATKNSQSRIFQHMTVPDILLQVLADYHVVDKIDKKDFKEREYCVQYRESDFNFVSRLMEEEGIYYFFEHADGLDKLVLSNVPSGHIDCPNKSEIPIIVEKVGSESWVSSVSEWQMDYELQTGKITLWDHHAQIPTQNHEHVELSIFNAGNNQVMEIYDFPGGYTKRFDEVDKTGGQTSNLQNIPADKQRVAKTLIQALDAQVSTVTAFSDCCTITSGHKFKLIQHPIKELNRQYLVISAEHEIAQNPGYPGMSDEPEGMVVNNFKCIPFGEKAPIYRPMRRTPQSIVQGTQTATVVGPNGQEIFTDKYGRVKVKFHWDQAQDNSDNTVWVRVGRDIAGNKWGTMYIPRIGQEVIIDFLHGDPDQPIIVGSVYNQQNMPHYELPKFKTLTYIKTKTSPDDGKGYNELRFEDKANKEQVFMRSQKRYDLRVRGSMYETCGGNRQEVIGFKQENQPGGNLAVTVAGNYDLHVQTDNYITIDGKLNEGVTGDVVEGYNSNQSTVVKSNAEINARCITLEASQTLTLKVGSSFIVLAPASITIQGPMVNINSGGSGSPTSPANLTDALDAETSDTGEPGFLDRPRTGGGGGRKTHTLNGQHAPAVTRVSDGVYSVGGDKLLVKGDPAYVGKTVTTLSDLYNTPTGKNVMDTINSGKHTTTIQTLDVATAQKNGALNTPSDSNGSVTPGQGSDSTIGYNPDVPDGPYFDKDGNQVTLPQSALLGHEMIHSVHNDQGTNKRDNVGPPAAETGSNEEESQTIGILGHKDDPMTQNQILKDLGSPYRRPDHDSTVVPAPAK